jgi:ketosteroid isomerase-like protein
VSDEQRIRDLYAALLRGDLEALEAAISPDAVWVNPPDAVEPGIRRGRDEVITALRGGLAVAAWTDLRPDEVTFEGEHAFVVVQATGTGRGSGAPLDARFVHMFEFRDGLIVRFEWGRDVEAARREFILRSGSSGDH